LLPEDGILSPKRVGAIVKKKINKCRIQCILLVILYIFENARYKNKKNRKYVDIPHASKPYGQQINFYLTQIKKYIYCVISEKLVKIPSYFSVEKESF
jgi:uncharacterized membrane protein